MSITPVDVDTAFLGKYQESINEVFQIYYEDINPFIVQFEILKNEFPIEIQNEIRAIYGHLVRASIADNDADVQRNIEKMRSHTKRALFDCFKYSCILISDKYSDFFERYRGIDLTYINKGHFIHDIQQKYRQATKQLQAAKELELSNASEDQLVAEYQRAYELFADIEDQLNKAESDAAFLKHRATRRDVLAIASFIIGAAGFLYTVLSTAPSFIK